MQITHTEHELIPSCDIRRREKVGALYSAVSGLLAFSSRAYYHGIYNLGSSVVIVVLHVQGLKPV